MGRAQFHHSAILAGLCGLLLSGCLGSQSPAPVLQYGLNGGATSAGVHIVAPGDTVYDIAARYRLAMQDVIHVNNMHAPYKLAAGQRLTLPPPKLYRVRSGDTLYDISRTFDISMTDIARQNSIGAPYVIRTGQELRLPSIAPAAGGRSAAAPVQMASVSRAAISREQLAAPVPGQRPSSGTAPASATAAPQNVALGAPRAASPTQVPLSDTPARAGSKFAWPVDGPVLSSYGPKPGGRHNDGINIGTARGAPVRAAENGVVVYADNHLKGYGNLILIRHADRWMTAYAHLDSFIAKKGQQVRKGETIGTAGMTGAVDSPQLHFEIRRGTEALNPALHLARQGS